MDMKDRDFTSVARSVVETAIGEHLDATPLEDPDAGNDPRAVVWRVAGLADYAAIGLGRQGCLLRCGKQ